MELKQKKTIFWSAAITIYIFISVYIPVIDNDFTFSSIFNYISFGSLVILYVPYTIIYRLCFGKIIFNNGFSWFYIMFFILTGLFIGIVLGTYIRFAEEFYFILFNHNNLHVQYDNGVFRVLRLAIIPWFISYTIVYNLLKHFIFKIDYTNNEK